MPMSRVAVITGASRGIGAATARVLGEQGFRVVVNYRSSAEEADEVVAAINAAGGESTAIRADVTVPDDVATMFDETEQRWGRVDVLVHNALIPYAITSFADLTWEQLGGKLDRELHAAFLVTKAVVPGMTSRGYGRLLYLTAEPSRRRLRDGSIDAAYVGSTLSPEQVAEEEGFHVLAWIGDHFQIPTVGVVVDPDHIPLDSPAPQALVRANQRALRLLAEQPSRAVDYVSWFLDRLTREEAQQYYERYVRPYFLPERKVDLNIAQQAIDAVAGELGVNSVAADTIYAPSA
jgi:nucleoside-diphosphate-sugar epimerase